MGGRGAYFSGRSKNYATREFDAIDMIGKVKVLKPRKGVENIHFPLYSNTKNTTYFVATPDGSRIGTIGFYRDHKIVKSIDITSNGTHWHAWIDGTFTRKGKTHPTRTKIHGENPITLERDRRLVQEAERWNAGRDG